MKKIMFAIVNDTTFNGRDYLICWFPNATLEDNYGLTWTSYEYFKTRNSEIMNDSSLGLLTVFDNREDAMMFINEHHIHNAKVIEVLF